MADKVDAAAATMIRNLKEKTGKTLDQWVALVAKEGCSKHGEGVKWLKSVHGMGHGYANLVMMAVAGRVGPGATSGDDLLDQQYAGDKAVLRPLYDRVLQQVLAFGADVEVAPKKTYVSLRRSKQFALVQPSTKTRLDVGLNLKGVPPTGRLEASGSFNSMCTHRVRVESAADIDKALTAWLRKAYDLA